MNNSINYLPVAIGMIACGLAFVCIALFIMWWNEKCINIELHRKKLNIIADDAHHNPIRKDDSVIYRGKKCQVFWDNQLLSYYLVPEDGNVLKGIPFTSYVARECEVVD